jgi:uncharacterized protein (TIGR03000 family)
MFPRLLCVFAVVVSLGAGSSQAQWSVGGGPAPSGGGHWIYNYMPAHPYSAPNSYSYYYNPNYYGRPTYYYPPGHSAPAARRPLLQGEITRNQLAAYLQREREQNLAKITVRLPADAELAINDREMKQSGAERSFVTPALPSAETYTFDLTARWNDDLGPRTQRTTVQVRRGGSYTVTFPRTEAAATAAFEVAPPPRNAAP